MINLGYVGGIVNGYTSVTAAARFFFTLEETS